MKKYLTTLLVLISTLVYSQQEASVWYFGLNAGIKFNANGTVTALTDGQLNTLEGCATISDNTGNLLFYTDGITVYNRNHGVMVNGSGLLGEWSSTQSATIVPKPGSTNLYYIFTLDSFAGANGFRYSEVDINLNGGLGAVTANKNVLIYTPTNEKLAIVKHANGIDYWVVTHGWNNNAFYSHLLTSSGLSTIPVISNVGLVVTGSTDNVWGYMKISPNGRKLAICNTLTDCELLDFDVSTGMVSNPQILYNGVTYGVEFSPNSEVLYVSVTDPSPYRIIQFDLNSSIVSSSLQTIYSSSLITPGALQLGPDNKIYIAELGKTKLGVINNPNIISTGCNLQMDAVDLGGRICQFGLPPFVTSFFYTPTIQFANACEGEAASFHYNTNQIITNTVWNFGDGSAISNSPIANHIYATAGTYTVTLILTSALGTVTNTRDITIYPKPIINPIVSLKQCDDNTDGFSVFNLTEANAKISTNFANETFSYFEIPSDAQSNINPIPNFTTYTNQIVSNDVIYVRISNTNGCFRVAQLNLIVSTTQIPVTFTRAFTQCDDPISGTNTDGVATFNFASVDTEVRALFPVNQLLTITYYRKLADALAESNAIADISNYRNIGYANTQNIYTRVDSDLNNDCLLLKSFITLNVERIPIVSPIVRNHCDDNQDGKYGFDTANLQTTLLNGLTNVTVTYFDQNNNPLPSPLPNPFVTASQTIKVVVTNNTAKACSYETTIQFVVDDLPEAFPIATTLTTVCDDEADPINQNGLYSFDTSTFQNTILRGQTGMTVNYYDGNNNPLPSPLPNPFVTTTQNVRVEIISPINTFCKATYTIAFVVKPVPNINLLGDELVCNEQTISKTIDAGLLDPTQAPTYTYVWKLNGNPTVIGTNYTLNINQAGIYTVVVSNSLNCPTIRTITVAASDKATITSVNVIDLTTPNSITVYVTGAGDYVYALDDINGLYQDENVFTNINAGIHTVYIKDLNGCGVVPREVAVLGIPDYFTPNGDGYNDYWNIKGANSSLNAKTIIYIFDRFGKLIKQITPTSQGWNGTLNNQVLPATDYWYSIELGDGRIVKGHFALKR